MSIFLASVPAGSPFYHGAGSADPIKGMEWLAFEPEHAMMFARAFVRPPKGPSKHPKSPASSDQKVLDINSALLRQEHPLVALLDDDPPGPPKDRPKHPRSKPGWLHTYRTKHALRLLYVDGMGAGKTSNGTLDTQDYLLLLGALGSHQEMWDVKRGQALCKLAKDHWDSKIDGFLRMEAGFEIILCDFEAHLGTVFVDRVNDEYVYSAGDQDHFPPADTWFNYWRAVMDRANGFPPGRAKIYYDDFVTAYGRGLELHGSDGDFNHPRLLNVSKVDLSSLRADVDTLVQRSDSIFNTVDEWSEWQSIVDLLVTRYASRLRYLTSSRYADSPASLHGEINRMLSPFVDYDNRSLVKEIERCTVHFLPDMTTSSTSLIAKVISSISHTICERMFAALEASDPHAYGRQGRRDAYEELNELITYLDWTVWKECPQCAVDELCVVPVWPFGALEDHEHPSCHNATVGFSQRGYWGNIGGGP